MLVLYFGAIAEFSYCIYCTTINHFCLALFCFLWTFCVLWGGGGGQRREGRKLSQLFASQSPLQKGSLSCCHGSGLELCPVPAFCQPVSHPCRKEVCRVVMGPGSKTVPYQLFANQPASHLPAERKFVVLSRARVWPLSRLHTVIHGLYRLN